MNPTFVSERLTQVCVPGAQTPAWHESPVVHELPSLQAVPFDAVGLEQTPVVGSQVPAVWHWSLAVHVTALPVHAPLWQTSEDVHALWSSHTVPSARFGFEHFPLVGSHVPAEWH